MFKIHDDKVYFVAETPNINKVIEIFLPKDDRGTIMDSHEIRVDLCRAVIHMEKKGVRVLKVRNIEDTNKASIDIWHMPEYQEAAESLVSDVVNACIESCFDSGAMFNLPCKANRKTHEVFAVECCASPDDDDSFSHADVEIDGQSYPLNFVSDIMDENDVNNALDEFYRIQQTGEYWEAHDGKSLTDAIHECRWAIYCTSNYEQAARWSKKGRSRGIVNVFEYTESPMLNIKKFPEMSDEWLDFIAICRSGKHHDYDIVEGPMADDTIWNYVNDFLSGDISREAFWALAKFKHPTHQISFHTEVALKCLSFKEAIEV